MADRESIAAALAFHCPDGMTFGSTSELARSGFTAGSDTTSEIGGDDGGSTVFLATSYPLAALGERITRRAPGFDIGGTGPDDGRTRGSIVSKGHLLAESRSRGVAVELTLSSLERDELVSRCTPLYRVEDVFGLGAAEHLWQPFAGRAGRAIREKDTSIPLGGDQLAKLASGKASAGTRMIESSGAAAGGEH